MAGAEIEALVAEVDLDSNGTLEFVEFQEVLLKLCQRARNELRRLAEAGLHAVSAGPVLLGLLQQSRAPKSTPTRCAALERERRLRAARAYSPRRMRRAPLKQAAPDNGAKFAAPPDERGAVMCRRSTLGESFPQPEEYACVLLLHALLEPASEARGALSDAELAAAGFWVPLPPLTASAPAPAS